MKYFWLSFKAIFVKDIVTELRAKQVLPTMIVLGMLIVWILRIASEAATKVAPESPPLIGAAALWIALLFSGLLAQEKSFATEHQQDCIYALLLAPVDAATIYLAKLLVNVVMLCIFELIIVPVVIVFFQLIVPDRWFTLIAVLMLGNIGISAVGTLFSAIVQLRGSLLSIVVLVILMPMMIPATSALMMLFAPGHSALVPVSSFASAIKYMIAFDAVFVTACWLLFGFAIKE